MSSKLNKPAYEQMIREDLEWLNQQPRSLEREHIKMIVAHSVEHYYPTQRIGDYNKFSDGCGGPYDGVDLSGL